MLKQFSKSFIAASFVFFLSGMSYSAAATETPSPDVAASGSETEVKNATDPYILIASLADKTFKELNAHKQDMTTNKARQIITDILLPYVDNKYSSYKVIGPNIKNTTREQRDKFTLAFTNYIVATYADALKKYTNQTIEVQKPEPIKDDIVPVRVTIHTPGAEDVEVIFKMRRNNKTHEWKAFDMVAEGISLLSAKQSELSGMIREKGIDSVSNSLVKHVKDTAGNTPVKK